MKKMTMIIAAVLMAAFAVQADAIWLSDVNGIQTTGSSDQSGWVGVKFPQLAAGRTNGVADVTMLDSLGTSSMVVHQWGLTGGGTSNNSGFVRTYTDIGSVAYDMYRDGFQFSGTNDGARLMIGFSGLDNSTTYSVTFWSYDYSFGASATQTFFNVTSGSEVSIGTVIMPPNNNAAGRPTSLADYSVTANGLSTDGSGNLIFSIWAGGTNEKINGFQINAVPEPATIGLLGLGALITLIIRRIKRH